MMKTSSEALHSATLAGKFILCMTILVALYSMFGTEELHQQEAIQQAVSKLVSAHIAHGPAWRW
jgi:hypothetical protein